MRENWSSRLGFILAAAGSAIGLGNLWRFPYITYENGGGGFVLIYLLAVIFIGLPIMITEIMLGKKAQANPVDTFKKLGNARWSAIGYLGVLSGAVILAYYTVIASWSLFSFYQCLKFSFSSYNKGAIAEKFVPFLSDGWLQIFYTTIFSLLTGAVLIRGVSSGIEKISKLLMPLLFLLLIYLVVTALLLDGASEGLRILFTPTFEKIKPFSFLQAGGQAFFSLSLGLGAMIAYGSYLKKDESILSAASWVVTLDTLVALLAAIAMFAIIYAVPDLKVSASTVGMLFIAIPEVFYLHVPGGSVLAPLFFVLVAFAALTSTISLGEVVIAFCIDTWKHSRTKATLIGLGVVFIGSIFSALSLGATPFLSEFSLLPNKQGVLDHLDFLASNIFLPLGALGTCIFAGWYLSKNDLMEAWNYGGATRVILFKIWHISVRYIAPLLTLGLFLAALFGKALG